MHDIIHKINVVLVKLLYANKLMPEKSKCAGLRLCAVYIDILSVFIIPSMAILWVYLYVADGGVAQRVSPFGLKV